MKKRRKGGSMKNSLAISCCIILIFLAGLEIYFKLFSHKDYGYFAENGEYKINNGEYSIVQKSTDEIKLYNNEIDIILKKQITRIGWNKDYIVILKEVDNYSIINCKNNEIIQKLDKKEYKKKMEELKINNIKLRTIGRYIIEEDRYLE